MQVTTEETTLSQILSKTLVYILEGWEPIWTDYPAFVELRWEGFNLSGKSAFARISDNSLEIVITSKDTTFFGKMNEKISTVSGILEDGSSFKGKTAYVSFVSFNPVEEGSYEQTVIKVNDWSIEQETDSELIWISQIDFSRNNISFSRGNLEINSTQNERPKRNSIGHLHIHGNYRYFLVKSRKERRKTWWIILDPMGDEPTYEKYCEDMFALEYTLGCKLTTSNFLGVDIELNEKSALGFAYGESLKKSMVQAPIPIEEWTSEFYSLVSKGLRGKKSAQLHIAIGHYLESLSSKYIDTQYILTMLGVESLISRYSESEKIEPSIYVKDLEKWLSWIESQKSAILSMSEYDNEKRLLHNVEEAIYPSRARTLSEQARVIAEDLPKHFEQEVCDYFEIQKRGTIRKENSESSINDFYKVMNARVLLNILIANIIEYKGPIYTSVDNNHRFSIQDKIYPIRQISWERAVFEFATVEKILWPKFNSPQLPRTRHIDKLAEFATQLSQQTSGKVFARIQPNPSQGETTTIDFKMILRVDPRIQSVIFSLLIKETELWIQNWYPKNKKVKTMKDISLLIKDIANSNDIKVRIERMLILSDEIESAKNR